MQNGRYVAQGLQVLTIEACEVHMAQRDAKHVAEAKEEHAHTLPLYEHETLACS